MAPGRKDRETVPPGGEAGAERGMLEEETLLREIGSPRILVVGDVILDTYIRGKVRRISPEAPIPVFEGGERIYRLGGAGNVAANLRALGASTALAGCVGTDPEGERILALLEELGVETPGLVRTEGRPSTRKTRFLSRDHQLLRWDEEETRPLEGETARRIENWLREEAPSFDAVVFSDYGKGVLTEGVIAAAVERARGLGIPLVVDPKGRDFGRYRGATHITPNQMETEVATGIPLDSPEAVERAADRLLQEVDLEAAVVTLGKEGIFFKTRAGEKGRLPARARALYDVTGAGDTVVSVLTFCLGAGVNLVSALKICNVAAGIVVGKLGAVPVSREEILGEIGLGRDSGKILDLDLLKGRLAAARERGERVVFTNGCFDILHAGHVRFLHEARSHGDLLVVGVNDDASVRRLKGEGRPVHPLGDRQEVLAALEDVDYLVSFSEDTPERLIREITPDVLVKGEDWRDKGVVGREWVESHGGKVILLPLHPGRSTTSALERLKAAEKERGGKEPGKPPSGEGKE